MGRMPIILTGLLTLAGTPLAAQQRPPRDVTADRGFFVATGRSLGHGHGNASLSYFWTPAVSIGAFDRITLTGGTPLWTGPSVGFASLKVQVVEHAWTAWSIGAFGLLGSGVEGVWPYVTGTVGTDRLSVTVLSGVGAGSIDVFETDLEGDVLIQGALIARVHDHVKVIVEGLQIFSEGEPAVLLGARLFGHRFAVDVAGVVAWEDTGQVLPWVSVAYGW